MLYYNRERNIYCYKLLFCLHVSPPYQWCFWGIWRRLFEKFSTCIEISEADNELKNTGSLANTELKCIATSSCKLLKAYKHMAAHY